MTYVLPDISITVWQNPLDLFSYEQLATNWQVVNDHDHTSGKGKRINTAALSDSSVSTAKIQDAAVTSAKIADGTVSITDLAAAVASALLPSGTVIIHAGASPPTGFLACDGSLYLRTDQPTLFASIGTTYGTTLSTNFKVPSLAGKVPIGVGGGYTLGQTGGEASHQLTTAEIPSHSHGVTDPGHTHQGKLSTNRTNPDGSLALMGDINGSVQTTQVETTSTTGVTIQNSGGGAAHNNIQPYLALNYFIKT